MSESKTTPDFIVKLQILFDMLGVAFEAKMPQTVTTKSIKQRHDKMIAFLKKLCRLSHKLGDYRTKGVEANYQEALRFIRQTEKGWTP